MMFRMDARFGRVFLSFHLGVIKDVRGRVMSHPLIIGSSSVVVSRATTVSFFPMDRNLSDGHTSPN